MRFSKSNTERNLSLSSTRSCNGGRRSLRFSRYMFSPEVSTLTTSSAAHSVDRATLSLQARLTLLNLHRRDMFTLLCRRGQIRSRTISSLRGGSKVVVFTSLLSLSSLGFCTPLSKTLSSNTSINKQIPRFNIIKIVHISKDNKRTQVISLSRRSIASRAL